MKFKILIVLLCFLSCQFLNGAAEGREKRENLMLHSKWILPLAGFVGNDKVFPKCFGQGSAIYEELVISRHEQSAQAIAKDLVRCYCKPEGVIDVSLVTGLADIYEGLARIRAMGTTENPSEALHLIAWAETHK